MGGTNGSGSGGNSLGSAVDIPPNTIKATVGYFLLRENGRVESFQPHMHLRGKAMAMEAILPNGQIQVLSHGRLQLQLAQHLRLQRDRGAAAAEGHADQGDRVARQHREQEVQPRSECVGRLWRSHGG